MIATHPFERSALAFFLLLTVNGPDAIVRRSHCAQTKKKSEPNKNKKKTSRKKMSMSKAGLYLFGLLCCALYVSAGHHWAHVGLVHEEHPVCLLLAIKHEASHPLSLSLSFPDICIVSLEPLMTLCFDVQIG
jgi:hypothetical protein